VEDKTSELGHIHRLEDIRIPRAMSSDGIQTHKCWNTKQHSDKEQTSTWDDFGETAVDAWPVWRYLYMYTHKVRSSRYRDTPLYLRVGLHLFKLFTQHDTPGVLSYWLVYPQAFCCFHHLSHNIDTHTSASMTIYLGHLLKLMCSSTIGMWRIPNSNPNPKESDTFSEIRNLSDI